MTRGPVTGVVGILALLGPILPTGLAGQQRPLHPTGTGMRIRSQQVAGEREAPPLMKPIVGGILAGSLGALAGGFIGYELACSSGCGAEFSGATGAVWGAVLGEMVLLPVGVHVGNGGRGRLGHDFAASVLSGAGGLALAGVFSEPRLLWTAPLLQLIATVAVERRTRTGDASAQRVGAALVPAIPLGLTGVVAWRF